MSILQFLHIFQDGQSATIEFHSVAALLRDTKESQELSSFPGPLRPELTHKNDVIKFCEKKISGVGSRRDIADKESYVLLWEMMVLLLRQKGQVSEILECMHCLSCYTETIIFLLDLMEA